MTLAATKTLDKLKNFLACVCGGAGKTRWATQEAKADLADGTAKLVVVVATTKNCRLNWRDNFKEAGIKVCSIWKGHAWKGKFAKSQAIIITYATMGRYAEQRRSR